MEKSLEGFPIPQVGRSRFKGWVRRDLTDRIPGDETLFKQYFDEWGLLFESMTINKILFAFNIDIDGKFPYDITLLDTDCDGLFDTKVEGRPDEHVDTDIPECVFSVGPARGR
ncbi:MAG: hypothetical protein V3V62_11125 [bacterium]